MVALQSVHVGLVFGFFIGLFTARIMLIGVCQEAAEAVEESHTTLRQQPEPMKQVGSVVASSAVKCPPNAFTPNSAVPALPVPNYAPQMKVYPEACSSSVLLGNEHHGGWYICREKLPPSSNCIVYSYGLGADWSFDKGAEALGCEVHGFDPSGLLWRQGMHGRDYSGIDYAKQYPTDKRIFHNWGIGVVSKAVYPIGSVPQEWPGLGDPQLSKSNSEPWELRSIEQTINDLGHRQRSISVLKIDVEGAEWDALAAFFEAMGDYLLAGNVQQLLLEYHWDPDSRARNARHAVLMDRVRGFGFVPWKLERHEGSDCCLDVSYIWVDSKTSTVMYK